MSEFCDKSKPPPGRVDVYGPQESSSDWVHEWALERTKVFKSSGRVGTQFYLERQDCEEIRADAELWAHRSLRLYMVTGPPGVGKTEFTVWLAGQMDLPIYRLSLTTPRLTDARLSQLLSQNSMKHKQVLVQIDEFQEVLRRWQFEPKSIDITPGGFNEVLQGSATLTRGVIVLTGLDDVVSEVNLNAHPALYRRFHVKVGLGYLGRSDIETFFRHFLEEFVTGNSEEDWQAWQARFMSSVKRQGRDQGVSIDMLVQFLMAQITKASVKKLGALSIQAVAAGGSAGNASSRTGSRKTFRIDEGCKDEFSKLICDGELSRP